MIRLEDVHRHFAHKEVYQGHQSFRPGQLDHDYTGRVGTGKSLLLRLMAGLDLPDRGAVFIDGQNSSFLSAGDLDGLRRRFGVMFQGPALFDHLTAAENVALAVQSSLKLSPAEVQAIVVEKLADVGLLGSEEKFPRQMDLGARRRCSLARALALNPEIVLLDEPTHGLDPATAWYVFNLIVRTHSERPVTFVITSRDGEGYVEVSDSAMLLYQGQIVAEGSPEDIRRDPDHLIRRYIDRSLGGPIPVR